MTSGEAGTSRRAPGRSGDSVDGPDLTALPPDRPRSETAKALLDAAERLLLRDGHEGLTTRRIAREADCNPALVHYHFQSLDDLLAQLLERSSARFVEQQRRAFAPGRPLYVQWLEVTRSLRGRRPRWVKVWFELTAASINRPVLASRAAAVDGEWRLILERAVAIEFERRGLPNDSAPTWAALMLVVLRGLYLERVQGVGLRMDDLLALLDDLVGAPPADLGRP